MKSTLCYSALFLFVIILVVSCNQPKQENHSTESIPDSVIIKKGDQLVSLTFDTLRNSLLTAIGEQGFAYAIQFCNEKAYPLTASHATPDIIIRRTSLQYRNPLNQPDSLEHTVFEEFKSGSPRTKLIRTTGEVHYIKPIIMQAMCLNCHGSPDLDIKPETMAAIQRNYPQDKAIGYAEGELRGIWHIIFRSEPD
ncbi:MAG: DUF3365 domain-containing protein [Cyclobacteriaceae bacterium]|nr:DUF3365 domain-containing protein [Cyclobacteriaceae bacterium]